MNIYRSFEQWKNGGFLEHGAPRTEEYTEEELHLVEMGWNYGYDAGRAVEQALDKKADNARELGLSYDDNFCDKNCVWTDHHPDCKAVQDSTCNETLRVQGKAYPRTCKKCGLGPCVGKPKPVTTPPAAQPALPPMHASGLVAIKTLLSRDPCAHAKVAIEMIDEMLAAEPQPVPVKTYHDGKPWPVAPKPWVGLSRDEVLDIEETTTHPLAFYRAIEAKLKEKNT